MKFYKQVKEFKSYMFIKNFTDRTIESYLNQLNLFIAFLDVHYPRITEVQKITKDVLFDYVDYLMTLKGKKKDRPLANSTIGKKIISLKSFFGFLVKHDYILSNPTSSLELPREEKTLPRVILNEKEVLEIINSIKTNTPIGLRNRAIVELFYSNGIRTSELCNLKIADVNFNEMIVIIYKGKGNKSRIVPMTQYASFYISEYIQKARKFLLNKSHSNDSNILFLNNHGNKFNKSVLNNGVMTPIMKNCNIGKNVTPYTFRHSIATLLVKRGVDIRYVQELLGHSSLSTTQKYCHLDITELKKVHSLYHPRETSENQIEEKNE